MSYKKEQFDRCVFNPLGLEAIVDRAAEIILPEWHEDPNLEKICRYIILVYDPKSPLVVDERDLLYRKQQAAELACLDLNDEETMERIYSFENEVALNFVVRYLTRYVKSKEWSAIVAIEFKYWESIKRLLTPISDGKDRDVLMAVQIKSQITEEVEKDIIRLDNLYKTFFGEDDVLERKAKKRVSPERIANEKVRS